MLLKSGKKLNDAEHNSTESAATFPEEIQRNAVLVALCHAYTTGCDVWRQAMFPGHRTCLGLFWTGTTGHP